MRVAVGYKNFYQAKMVINLIPDSEKERSELVILNKYVDMANFDEAEDAVQWLGRKLNKDECQKIMDLSLCWANFNEAGKAALAMPEPERNLALKKVFSQTHGVDRGLNVARKMAEAMSGSDREAGLRIIFEKYLEKKQIVEAREISCLLLSENS